MSTPQEERWALHPNLVSCRVVQASGPNKGDGVAQAVTPDGARLIAAAPDLLFACRTLAKALEDLAPWTPEVAEAVVVMIGMGRDAIAKATGGGT